MNERTYNPNQGDTAPFASAKIPRSIITASRDENTNLILEIKDGKLPEDIQGHVFIVAPVGTIDSDGLPLSDGSSLLNGDGMIYRLDFEEPGKVTLKNRLAKPPDYYADKATHFLISYQKYRFRNHGVTRFSPFLGLRNELNTAFLVMQSNNDSLGRLLVTYDAGRPYEIDTETLEAVTPIGANQEWRAELDKPRFPFKPILSSAHPSFDTYTGEMFTVNYGRSITNFLETIPAIFNLEELPEVIYRWTAGLLGFFSAGVLRVIFKQNRQWAENILKEAIRVLQKLIGEDMEDFVYLIRWDGEGCLERWRLRLPDGSPIIIEQTVHQIGISRDYVILMDTSFATGIAQVLGNPLPEEEELERVLRELLERPALPTSSIYLVRRSDLKAGQRPAISDQEVTVIAKKLVIPLPASHFLVDYENPEEKISLHISHIASWDVAEWIRGYDLSAYPPHDPIGTDLHSMEASEMDISRLGRYVIDGDKGTLTESKVIYSSPYTWGTGLYAYRDRLSSGKQSSKIENIYWTSLGLWPELMTQFFLDLYQDSPYQAVPLDNLLDLAKQGVPSYLFRLQTREDSLTIKDSYPFPKGCMCSSPQFIPRRGSEDSSTDGYIVCTVYKPESRQSNEYWIFDAANLAGGPLCTLSHPDLNFGYSLHTAWLPKIGPRQVNYNVPIRSDFQELVKEQSLEIQKLFKEEIYPHFQNK
jgi:hypothetical protein